MSRASTKPEPAVSLTHQQVLVDMVRRIDTVRVSRNMTGKFRADIPAYARLPEILVSTVVTEIVRQNVEAFVRCVVESRAPTDQDMVPFRRSARQRAAEGMPLEDLMHAYRLGGRLLWQELSEAAAPEERAALPTAADLVMNYIDAVSDAVTRAYLGQERVPVSEDERGVRELFDALAAGEPLLPAEQELAEQLDFPLRESYRPFVAAVSDAAPREQARLAEELRARGALALTEGERVVGVLPESAEAPPGGGRIVMALGEPVARAGLGEAVDEMRLLHDLSQASGPERELSVDEFLPELLLARSPHLATTLRRRVLGGLEDYADRRSSDLLDTLDALVCCDLDRRQTAAQLHVHRNTLDYRVRRIEELAGIDLSRPRDVMLVSLALRQRKLEAAGATPPGPG